ncbi:MAG TPA: CPBP family intramembrane glutamic endopeptidase [Nocardioidaceae bacterium]|nr:CPBP family intramembrane glutamic endopeptidase [Nocardioidaceae bacterium]
MAGTSTTATRRTWSVLAGIEALVAVVAVALDLFVVTFVLLAMLTVSLVARREGPSSIGLHRPAGAHLAGKMLAFAVLWSVFQLSVTLPVASHVSGKQQDLSAFDGLKGDLPQLAALLLLSWTLAALGEELAYRGYLFTRIRQTFGERPVGVVAAVGLSSVLFGWAHSEQGAIGVLVVATDALAWSLLRLRYDTLWAPVLAHGFNNTVGFVAFFLVGPIHGFW